MLRNVSSILLSQSARKQKLAKRLPAEKRKIAGDNLNNIDITSELEIHKTESKAKPKPSSMAEFLDSFSKKSTRRMYRRGIELFCEWCGKDVETILKERKDDLTLRANSAHADLFSLFQIF